MSHVAPVVDHVQSPVVDIGKLVERRGRKASDLRVFLTYDSGVAVDRVRARAFVNSRGSNACDVPFSQSLSRGSTAHAQIHSGLRTTRGSCRMFGRQ